METIKIINHWGVIRPFSFLPLNDASARI